MKKINVAELLKNCPSGMELDCVSYDNVSFDKVSDDKKSAYPIFCYITDEKGNRSGISFTENGHESKRYGAKCVIFPKGKTTWEGFQRPFKDGDVLAYQYPSFTNPSIYIHKYSQNLNTAFYVALGGNGSFMVGNKFIKALYGNNSSARFATEEEKQKLFDTIKENGYKWNPETKTLEKLIEPNNKEDIGVLLVTEPDNWELVHDKFDITTLKPFESRVLIRDGKTDIWNPAIWGYLRKDGMHSFPYIVVGGLKFNQCIPYEGNEHLLGTTDDCNEYYKTWE